MQSSTEVIIGFLGSFTVIFIAVIGFFLKRERELGTLQERQKRAHERIDDLKKVLDKHINGKGEKNG
jgi:hypothetical protein